MNLPTIPYRMNPTKAPMEPIPVPTAARQCQKWAWRTSHSTNPRERVPPAPVWAWCDSPSSAGWWMRTRVFLNCLWTAGSSSTARTTAKSCRMPANISALSLTHPNRSRTIRPFNVISFYTVRTVRNSDATSRTSGRLPPTRREGSRASSPTFSAATTNTPQTPLTLKSWSICLRR